MRTRAVGGGLVAALTLAAGVHAAPVVTAPPAAERLDRGAVLARAAATRHAVSTGTVSGAVHGLGAVAGVTLPATPPARASRGSAFRSGTGALPVPVATAVARLLEAFAAGAEAVDAAVGIAPHEASEAVASLRARRHALAPGDATGVHRLAAEAQEVGERVDVRGLLGGAHSVASAVDAAVPVLRAYAADLGPGVAGAGCDVLDTAAVCIGGTGSNTYTRDAPLVIDLGGDDVHSHGAGAAHGPSGRPVSVSVDLAGNDRYETAVPTASGLTAVHGAGVAGIGLLVDVAGDDRYRAQGGRDGSATLGQGVGGAGVGILADMAGNDSYLVESTRVARPTQGQGYAVAGAGALVDGGGDDTYTISARTPVSTDGEGLLLGGSPYVQGLGFGGLGGGALVADLAGRDAFTLEARPEAIPADAGSRTRRGPSAGAEGLGYGSFGASAAVLTGAGPTAWTARAIATGPSAGATDIDAFAVSDAGPFAVLQDLGGDDTYIAEATTTATVAANGGCETCEGLEAVAEASTATVAAGGVGGIGAAVLHDRGGDDVYRARAVSTATAQSRDEGSGASRSFATAGRTTAGAWGVGTLTGAGFFADADGNDAYEIDVRSAADARANGAGSRHAEAASGLVHGWGLGMGSTAAYGEFTDGGGADTYRVTGASAAGADPPTVESPEVAVSSVLGSVEMQPVNGVGSTGGAAVFVDRDGLHDRVSITPEDKACQGTRGRGAWVDCGQGLGTGVMLGT